MKLIKKCFKMQVCLLLLGALVILIVVGVVSLHLHSKTNRSEIVKYVPISPDNKETTTIVNNKNSSNAQINVTKESDNITHSLVDRNYVQIKKASKEDYPISAEQEVSIKKEYGLSVRFPSIVNKSVEKLSDEKIGLFLSELSTFNDPDSESDSGVQAERWLISEITQTLLNNKDYPGNVVITEWSHYSWKQPTVILRFHGYDPTLKSELVVLGVDLDTKYDTNSTQGPGDNGGGSAVLLETTRVLLETKFIPKRSIELHWYASGEGEKQRGQVEVAESYTRSGQKVFSVVTFDTMCYFLLDGSISSFIKVTTKHLWDFPRNKTDDALEAFLRTAVKAYLSQPVTNINCDKGCYYDNTTWAGHGVTTAWPIPYPCNVNPTNGSYTNSNIDRALQFAKLATVYAIEIAEPSN